MRNQGRPRAVDCIGSEADRNCFCALLHAADCSLHALFILVLWGGREEWREGEWERGWEEEGVDEGASFKSFPHHSVPSF